MTEPEDPERLVVSDSLPLAPIEPFPTKKVDPHTVEIRALPDYALSTPPGKITISFFDRGYLYIVQTVEYSKWIIALLRVVGAIGLFYATLNPKEKISMKALKISGKLLKIIGGAVGVGGFLSGFVSPELAAIIYGSCMVLGNAIQFAGDIMDDGKVNNSFSLEG